MEEKGHVTTSTHNGSEVHREHNRRNRKVTDKEDHIDPNGHSEIWLDENPIDAYKRLFGKAVEEYNKSLKRPERRIKNYYRKIEKSPKQHTVYEMIVGIYNNKDNPGACSKKMSHKILRKFIEDWKKRNPNLVLIGVYYHADELGQPHIHVNYVPVAHNYKNGPAIQPGLVKALGEQGFEMKRGGITAQIQWEKSESEYLEALCNEHDLIVDHPQEGKGVAHATKEAYIAEQKLKEVKAELDEALKEFGIVERTLDEVTRQRDEIKLAIENYEMQCKSQYDMSLDELLNGFGDENKNKKNKLVAEFLEANYPEQYKYILEQSSPDKIKNAMIKKGNSIADDILR